MNYREQQLRQLIKRDYVPLKQHQTLIQNQTTLAEQLRLIQLDIDYQLQVQTKQENQNLKQELKNLQTD